MGENDVSLTFHLNYTSCFAIDLGGAVLQLLLFVWHMQSHAFCIKLGSYENYLEMVN